MTLLDCIAWSGWAWAACIYVALRFTAKERDDARAIVLELIQVKAKEARP